MCGGPPSVAEEGVRGGLVPEPLPRETVGSAGVALCGSAVELGPLTGGRIEHGSPISNVFLQAKAGVTA